MRWYSRYHKYNPWLPPNTSKEGLHLWVGWSSRILLECSSRIVLGWSSRILLEWSSTIVLGWSSRIVLGDLPELYLIIVSPNTRKEELHWWMRWSSRMYVIVTPQSDGALTSFCDWDDLPGSCPYMILWLSWSSGIVWSWSDRAKERSHNFVDEVIFQDYVIITRQSEGELNVILWMRWYCRA